MPRRLRLASFNLLSGRSLSDGAVVADRLAEAVRALDADVLALQEVDRDQPRSGGADQLADVVAAMGDGAVGRFMPTLAGTPGTERSWVPVTSEGPVAGPAYGIGLASRRPVREWRVLRFHAARGRFPLLVPGAVPDGPEGPPPGTRPRPTLIWLHDEPRAAVAAVLEEPRMTVVCTHLSFVPLVGPRQLARLRRWVRRLPQPAVVLGDLNLPGRLPARVFRGQPLALMPTFPSPAPRVQLDHALGLGLPEAAVRGTSTPEVPLSDHLPLVVDLDEDVVRAASQRWSARGSSALRG